MAFNSQMHDRNIYKDRPDFAQIALDFPEFRRYALSDAKGKVRVDFTDPEALRILTKILLKKDFNLTVEIPKGFLIPTVPQRLNYILWMEDLLSILPTKNRIPCGIDIGCGPCAIFSILGAKKNGWKFISTDTSQEALQWAESNIEANSLGSLIKVVKVDSGSALKDVLSSKEDSFDFCLCNPPFFENMEDIRKKRPKVKDAITTIVKEEEIFSEGGEVAFVKKIIEESLVFKNKIKIYTSMFGKKKSFVEIFKVLQDIEDIYVTKSQFCQGNTIRWGVAWTFEKSVEFKEIEKPKPKKPKKAKPPLLHPVPKDITCPSYNVQELSRKVFNLLKELEILINVVRVHEHYTESQITTDKNTWSHQRRKRREQKRNIEILKGQSLTKNLDNESEKLTLISSDSKSTSNSDMIPTTSVFKTERSKDSSNAESFDSSTSYCSAVKKENKECCSEVEASEKNLDIPDSASKKRKLCEADSVDRKKLRLEHDQSKQISTSGESNKSVYKPEASSQYSKDSEVSDSASKKRKLCEADSTDHKKARLEIDQSEQKSKLHSQFSENISDVKDIAGFKKENTSEASSDLLSNVDSNTTLLLQKSSVSAFKSNLLQQDLKKEPVELVSDYESSIPKENNTESGSIKNDATIPVKIDEINDSNFEPKSLLFCTMKIRRAKDVILIEMNCPEESNRETMNQIFQYLKNKLH